MFKFIKKHVPWNKGKKGYRCYYKRIQDLLPKICALIKAGNSAKQIALKLKIHTKTIYEALIKNNLVDEMNELKKIGKMRVSQSALKVKEDIFLEINRLSLMGRGVDAIGKELGLHGTTIRYQLIKRLGKDEYQRRHSIKKYKEYWSGKYYTNDRGDILQSGLEEKVADYLYKNGIKYKTHKCLTLPEGKFFPDFYLEYFDIYIEVFGMSDLEFYKVKMKIKINSYEKNGVKFIGLNKEDFVGDYFETLLTNLLNKNVSS